MQWNADFRDTIQKFVRGDYGLVPELMTRMYGSADHFPDDRLYAFRPRQSVIYVNGDNFHGPGQRTQALQYAKHTMDADLIEPLREMAHRSASPLQKNVIMGLAELSSLFHTQSLGASQAANKRMKSGDSDQSLLVPDEQIQQITAIADRVLNFAKEARRWEQPRTLVHGLRQ